MSLLGDYKILYLKTASMTQFYPAACITTHDLSETIEFIPTTTIENYQSGETWETQVPGGQSYNLSFEGLQLVTLAEPMGMATYAISGDKISYDALVGIKRRGELVQWRIDSNDSQQFGFGYIQQISEAAPSGDWLTYSCVIIGNGKLSFSSKISAYLFQGGQDYIFQNGETFIYN